MTTQKIIIAGISSGEHDLITQKVLTSLNEADLILVPRAKNNDIGIAEKLLREIIPDKILTPLYFPMISNENQRDEIIFNQIKNLEQIILNSRVIFFPVIGDSTLYSTGKYLFDALKKFLPTLELEFIPGISAHSIAAACAKKFLAMSDEILSIVPATANPEKIKRVLELSDVIAIYKPSALKNFNDIIKNISFKEIITVQKAGTPDEKIFYGQDAVNNISEYMSVILIWR